MSILEYGVSREPHRCRYTFIAARRSAARLSAGGLGGLGYGGGFGFVVISLPYSPAYPVARIPAPAAEPDRNPGGGRSRRSPPGWPAFADRRALAGYFGVLRLLQAPNLPDVAIAVAMGRLLD
jgi:hypothetical protein